MSGITQLFGGLNPAGGSVPSTLDIGSLLNIGLSPFQNDLVSFFGGEQDVRTRDIYSRLGLGGSTMMAEDLGGNELARLAKSAELATTNQQTALAGQGQQLTAQQQAFNQGQTNLKNITGGLGSLASAAGNLFG
jgi:hypothetical protein